MITDADEPVALDGATEDPLELEREGRMVVDAEEEPTVKEEEPDAGVGYRTRLGG